MIHKNIASALYESQLQTINMLITYIKQHDSFKTHECIVPIIDEFRKTLTCLTPSDIHTSNSITNNGKQKKMPSAYNMFIRDKIHEYKKQYPECNGHDLMRLATSAWKKRALESNTSLEA